MNIQRQRVRKTIYLLFWPLGLTLSWVTAFYSRQIEEYYASGFSKAVTQCLSTVTGIFPFSLAEVLVWILGVAFLMAFFRIFLNKLMGIRQKKSGQVRSLLYKLLIVSGIIYFCFILVWGLNYNRLSFAEIAGLKAGGVSEKELVLLCEKLITKAEYLRTHLQEDQGGVMMIEGGFEPVGKAALTAFTKAESVYPELGGNYGKPKPVFFSKLMSYTGISGVYFPFTGEANVNVDIPDSMLPSTACHEMAHQRGFAREDESNYIAWVACNSIDNPEFQYSGTILALIHSMNALSETSPEHAKLLRKKYSEGVRRDLQDLSEYWKKYEGKIEEISSDINDAYLKSNRQEEGIQSYGRMVDLLLAEQRAGMEKGQD